MKFFKRIASAVKDARSPAPARKREPTIAVKTPGTHEVIELPKLRLFDHPPTPEESRDEARRIAFAYAKQRSGNPALTWKQAKLLIDRWAKEERAAERAAQRGETA